MSKRIRKHEKRIKKRELLIQINQKLDTLLTKYNENFNKIVHKAHLHEKQSEMLKNVKFKLDKAKVFFDGERGIYGVNIKLIPNDFNVYVDNGEVIRNEFLYSISSMNLLPMKDMNVLSDLFEQAKERSKHWTNY